VAYTLEDITRTIHVIPWIAVARGLASRRGGFVVADGEDLSGAGDGEGDKERAKERAHY
jgi:hypothetical protein